jgi:hypothetical protein
MGAGAGSMALTRGRHCCRAAVAVAVVCWPGNGRKAAGRRSHGFRATLTSAAMAPEFPSKHLILVLLTSL